MESEYRLMLEDGKGNGIGLDGIRTAHFPREGETLEFSVSDLTNIRDYSARGWTEKTVRPFAGTYVITNVRHLISRSVNEPVIVSSPLVTAKMTKAF